MAGAVPAQFGSGRPSRTGGSAAYDDCMVPGPAPGTPFDFVGPTGAVSAGGQPSPGVGGSGGKRSLFCPRPLRVGEGSNTSLAYCFRGQPGAIAGSRVGTFVAARTDPQVIPSTPLGPGAG